jgi:hypothetical protein
LNRFRGALEAKRVEVKKQLLDPYNDFEVKVKELVRMVDEANAGIDAQVKGFEEQIREEKRKAVEGAYGDIVPEDFRAIMPLEKITDPKWLNATTTIKTAAAAIQQRFDQCMIDLDVIKELGSPYAGQIKALYIQTLDIGKAIAEGKRLEADAAKVKEYEEKKAQKEAGKQAGEAAQAAPGPAAAAPPPMPAPAAAQEAGVPAAQPGAAQGLPQGQGLREISFRMWVTPVQLEHLRNWIRENRIRVEKVE